MTRTVNLHAFDPETTHSVVFDDEVSLIEGACTGVWPKSCLIFTGELEFRCYSGPVYDHTELCFCICWRRRPAGCFGFWPGHYNARALGNPARRAWSQDQRYAVIFALHEARFAGLSAAVSTPDIAAAHGWERLECSAR